jgi:hypothetical protein
MFAQDDIEVCFLLQTKKEICSDSFASSLGMLMMLPGML